MKKSIVFFGADQFGIFILDRLSQESDFLLQKVVCPPPKKFGRKGILSPSPLESFAREKGLEVLNVSNKEDMMQENDYDFMVLVAFGFLIPPEVLEIPRIAPLCVHPSLLPKFRGASPIQSQILSGEKEGGTSIFIIQKELDAGKVLAQEKIKISEQEDYFSLSEKLEKISADLIVGTMKEMLKGKVSARTQDETKKSFCRKISKQDGEVDFQKDSADLIYRKFRAFKKWPGVFFFYGKKRIKILDMSTEEVQNRNDLLIKCSDGKQVSIAKLQVEGKNPITAQEFMNGYPDFYKSII